MLSASSMYVTLIFNTNLQLSNDIFSMTFNPISWLKAILPANEEQDPHPAPHEFDGIDFRTYSDESEPFDLTNTEQFNTTCKGYTPGSKKQRCTFEELEYSKSKVTVNHFALHDDWIGNGKGEVCVRAFAKMIEAQKPTIETIEFALYKWSIREEVRDKINQKLDKLNATLQGTLSEAQIKQKIQEERTRLEDKQARKLASARKNFLEAIGAESVTQGSEIRNPIGNLIIQVTGTWKKDKWLLSDDKADSGAKNPNEKL